MTRERLFSLGMGIGVQDSGFGFGFGSRKVMFCRDAKRRAAVCGFGGHWWFFLDFQGMTE